MKTKKQIIFSFSFLIFICLFHSNSRGEDRGIKIVSTKSKPELIDLYKSSHALLVGVSDYSTWPDLKSIPEELEQLESSLRNQGFTITKVMNPNANELQKAFEDFIKKYGYQERSQLLFFFSGHGFSRKNGKKGYLVPADSPDPNEDEIGFLKRALPMTRIITWSKEIEAKHALFLFDSCFSGTIFKSRALNKIPGHISQKTARPVRQFISSGSAGETVPARSVFAPLFIRAIEGQGDLNSDGYVTGEELGMYLNKEVMVYETGQTPQYGKIRDPDLDEGDFVFQIASTRGIVPTPKEALPIASVEIEPEPQAELNMETATNIKTANSESTPLNEPIKTIIIQETRRPIRSGSPVYKDRWPGSRRSKPMIAPRLRNYINSFKRKN